MNGLDDGIWFYENQVCWSYDSLFGCWGLYVSSTPYYGDKKWLDDLVPLLEELKDQVFNLKTKMYEMA